MNKLQKVMYLSDEVENMSKTVQSFVNDHLDTKHHINFNIYDDGMIIQGDSYDSMKNTFNKIDNAMDNSIGKEKQQLQDLKIEALNTMVIPFYKELINSDMFDYHYLSTLYMNENIITVDEMKKKLSIWSTNMVGYAKCKQGVQKAAKLDDYKFPIYLEMAEYAYTDDGLYDVHPVTEYDEMLDCIHNDIDTMFRENSAMAAK